MTFDEAAGLHLDHVVTVYVVILDKFLYIYQVGSSFS
jgi:hypothetical protein